MRNIPKNMKGFTLVELMVSIAIVALLAAIAVPAYNYYLREAREVSLDEALHEMREAISVYVVTHAKLPASDKQAGIAEYNVGMTFTIEPDASSPQKGRLVARQGSDEIFFIRMQADNGSLDWQCVPVSSATNTLLPADCQKPSTAQAGSTASTASPTASPAGTSPTGTSTPAQAATTTAAVTCPPAGSPDHTEKVTAGGVDSCAKPCASGEKRDTANPVNCIADTPSEPPKFANIPAGRALRCTVCKVPNPALCFMLTEEVDCPDTAPYCISEITNYADGSKEIDRRCGTYDEASNDWWHSTSDDPDCQDYDPNQNTEKDIHCTFACVEDNCNSNPKPSEDTLYAHGKD